MDYFLTFIRMFQDLLADNTRKRISECDVFVSCQKLAQLVLEKYKPDLIIAIDDGGSVPGEMVASAMNIPIVHIVARRDIKIARRYSLDPIPLRWLISMYHHFLFQTVKPEIISDITIDLSGKKILIVDDSLHTGATIDVVTVYLRKIKAVEIQVAALSCVSKRRPDFYILPCGNYSFPWSRDYVK